MAEIQGTDPRIVEAKREIVGLNAQHEIVGAIIAGKIPFDLIQANEIKDAFKSKFNIDDREVLDQYAIALDNIRKDHGDKRSAEAQQMYADIVAQEKREAGKDMSDRINDKESFVAKYAGNGVGRAG